MDILAIQNLNLIGFNKGIACRIRYFILNIRTLILPFPSLSIVRYKTALIVFSFKINGATIH